MQSASVLLPSVAYSALSTLSHKRYDVRKNVIEHKTCVLSFSTTLAEIFLILKRNERDMIKNVYRSACKVPVILARF
jgi:hypothetical protein